MVQTSTAMVLEWAHVKVERKALAVDVLQALHHQAVDLVAFSIVASPPTPLRMERGVVTDIPYKMDWYYRFV